MKYILRLFSGAAVLALFLTAFPTLAQVGVNATGTAPHSSAGLDVDFSNRGFLPPRMTTAQRLALVNPAEGLQVYNTDKGCIEFYTASGWRDLCGQPACSAAPSAAPSEGTHVTGPTSITWNWSPVAGASGYRYHTSNDYSGATDVGILSTVTSSGLTCGGTPYTLYVWAYNPCGVSPVAILQATTGACPFICGSAALAVEHTAGDVAPATVAITYGTVVQGSMCWITRNLGATQDAASADDNSAEAGGWYWQFNRRQGYAHDGVNITPAWSWASIVENTDWTQAEDPCALLLGSPWHMPTESEWNQASSSWTSHWDAFASPLKAHSAGYIYGAEGTVYGRGQNGEYWTATRSADSQGLDHGRSVGFGDGYHGIWNNQKVGGRTVRCVRNA